MIDLNSCLFIESDEFIQDTYTKLLLNYFDSVFLATNQKETLDKLKLHQPSLVIIDLQINDECSLDTIEMIHTFNHNIQIIAISAFNTFKFHKLEKTDMKNIYLLIKPIHKKQLEDIISEKIMELNNEFSN